MLSVRLADSCCAMQHRKSPVIFCIKLITVCCLHRKPIKVCRKLVGSIYLDILETPPLLVFNFLTCKICDIHFYKLLR